jgi:hypothetical protein
MRELIALLFIGIITIGIILALREVTCWYLKQTAILRELQELNKLMRTKIEKISQS